MSGSSSATSATSDPISNPEASPADLSIWSTFLGRSVSTSKASHTRTTSSASSRKIPNLIRSELDAEAAIGTILAPYHKKEADRRKSSVSEGEKPSPAGRECGEPEYKTAHGEPAKAMLNRIGEFVGNLVYRRGWKRS